MSSSTDYTPPADSADWARVETSRLDPSRLADAVAFAEASESQWPPTFHYPDGRYVGIVEWNEKGPWSEVAGVVRHRGGAAGLVLDRGRIAAEWGVSENNRRAKFYELTSAGRQQLAQEQVSWTRLSAAVGEVLAKAD